MENLKNDQPFHLTTPVAPTPASWTQLLLDLIATQCHHGISWNELLLKLQSSTPSVPHKNNQVLSGEIFIPTTSLTSSFANLETMNLRQQTKPKGQESNLRIQRYLFQLLLQCCRQSTDVVESRNDLNGSNTAYTSSHTTTKNQLQLEPAVAMAAANGMLLSVDMLNTITLDIFIEKNYLFIASLTRRRKALESSGLLHGNKKNFAYFVRYCLIFGDDHFYILVTYYHLFSKYRLLLGILSKYVWNKLFPCFLFLVSCFFL